MLRESAQADPHAPSADPNRCPNCDTPATGTASPYCSKPCRDQAAFVRQFRAAIASGTILEAEKQTVFGERLWWLLGGGLPMRESRIPESAKRQVIKRCASMCESCGAPMHTIENWGSGCNRPLHLRAVCERCSKTKAFGDQAFCQGPSVARVIDELSTRVFAPRPVRACDDHETWDWRAFIAQRRLSAHPSRSSDVEL